MQKCRPTREQNKENNLEPGFRKNNGAPIKISKYFENYNKSYNLEKRSEIIIRENIIEDMNCRTTTCCAPFYD